LEKKATKKGQGCLAVGSYLKVHHPTLR